ncbi:MAG: CRISPR-associated ring nuclease Csm6 [Rhodoferax sp.]|nr:CRISPR-associated ring nuclease Csm6 [Rhodoferax sp.]
MIHQKIISSPTQKSVEKQKNAVTTEQPADPRKPESYPRRVLVAVSGLSPQIVTETIYALTQIKTPAWIPTEVHLLTTVEGAQRARLSLFSNDRNWFNRLCKDYALPAIQFDEKSIHILHDHQGKPMSDIRSVEDNTAAANAITTALRQLSADSKSALHVSIAGGRKTMGFYVGYALSLFGRAQDRLSHVLVSEAFESIPDFFYPTPYASTLNTRTGGIEDSQNAKVTLAEIPFVSLRHGMPESLLKGNASFNETVDAARQILAAPELHIYREKGYIEAGGKKVNISPTSLALLVVFAKRTRNGQAPLQAPKKLIPDVELGKTYANEYKICLKGISSKSVSKMFIDLYTNGMDGERFSPILSRLNKELRSELQQAAEVYCVQKSHTRPVKYMLGIPAEAIFIY